MNIQSLYKIAIFLQSKKRIILLLTIIVLNFRGYSQQLTVDGALLTVSNEATLMITGSIENKGNIQNAGTILLEQHWINTGNYYPDKSEFHLIGLEQQRINHQADTFHILQISGGSEKLFESDAIIRKKLDLSDGLITPPFGTIFLLEQNATVVNASEFSYINGFLYRAGTGYRFFPVGKDGLYRPVELKNIQGDDPIVGFETHTMNENSKVGITLDSLLERRSWKMSLLSGSFTGSAITLWFGSEDNISDAKELVIAEADDSNSWMRSIGVENVEGTNLRGTITSEMPITGSYFAFGIAKEPAKELVYIPTAFSPHAEKEDDRRIKIYGNWLLAKDFSFQVYNKWQTLIFETTSLEFMTTTGWDGTNSKTGKKEILGHYNYILKAKLKNGRSIQKAGSILIVK